MSYQVLALKYRPQTFNEVIGQDHVTRTLSNAIETDRVAHAILFTGPRGTGKTTIARILAKAMNCKQGPISEPCNQCEICKEIINGHCADVFEIDGASNNSVDQVRDLRENVTYMPASAAYKIYIIDEVHMLSTAAFNALLKTLEEPPNHVMFVFATTEAHKIPETILSRCQRHDLGKIQLDDIANHLDHLCDREGFTIEKNGLELIATEVDGSIRDALSLLDRVLSSSSSSSIDLKQVIEGLAILDRQVMYDISNAILSKKSTDIVALLEKIDNSGMDLKKFYADLILHFRNMNMIKLCGIDTAIVNISRSEKALISKIVENLSDEHLKNILQHLLNEESLIKYTTHTRTAIELVLLNLIQINPGASIDKIIGKLNSLLGTLSSQPTKAPVPSNPAESVTPPLDSPAVTEKHSSAKGKAVQDTPDSEIHPNDSSWGAFLNNIEQKWPFIYALLSKAKVDSSESQKFKIILTGCSAFDKHRLDNKKKELENLCHRITGRGLEIKISANMTNDNKTRFNAKHAALNHPMVVEAQKIFNGKILNY